jgi:class 3 adenylate cyclase
MSEFPTGTVTFLFTDIEGSTDLARRLGNRWPDVLGAHHEIVRRAIGDHDGVEVLNEGDAFFAVFGLAADAVAATADAQRALAAHEWPPDGAVRVRMGLHTGEGRLAGGAYVGLDVHQAARIAALGHGDQVLVSQATRALTADKLPSSVSFRDLGEHRLRSFPVPQRLHQLVVEGLPADFPPLETLAGRANLPMPLSSFVGRGRAVQELRELIGATRLLTLTRPGGTGKTRLAFRLAGEMTEEFRDGCSSSISRRSPIQHWWRRPSPKRWRFRRRPGAPGSRRWLRISPSGRRCCCSTTLNRCFRRLLPWSTS